MKKLLFLTILYTFSFIHLYSQNSAKYGYILRANLARASQYTEFASADGKDSVRISPGGGAGGEVGLFLSKLSKKEKYYYEFYTNLEYHFHYAHSGYLSYSFNRKTIFTGMNFKVYMGTVFVAKFGVTFGGGLNYSFLGTMKMAENKYEYGEATFKPNYGYHFDLGFIIIRKSCQLIPSLRFRDANFDINKFTGGQANPTYAANVNKFRDGNQEISMSGFDLSITFRKTIRNSKD